MFFPDFGQRCQFEYKIGKVIFFAYFGPILDKEENLCFVQGLVIWISRKSKKFQMKIFILIVDGRESIYSIN